MVFLKACAPFDFAHTLRFLSGFRPTAGEQDITDGVLTKALRANGHTVLVRLAQEESGVRCTRHATEEISAATAEAVADRVSFYLSLDDDLGEFYDLGRADPAFAPIIDELYGYHQVKFTTPLENAVWAVLSQRTLPSVAASGKRALAAEFGNELGDGAGGEAGSEAGNEVECDGRTYVAFPDVEQLASLTPGRIAELVGNQRKGTQLHGLFQGWLKEDEEFLRHAPYQEVKDFLLGLPGIGAWSSSFVLIRGLGRTDEVPFEKALIAAASRVYGRPVNEAGLRRLAEPYGRWAGYWAHYLRVAG
ncbi:DNA-3-methyladenine glycosylase 2 family protein [Actinomadura barringtoniae]|uniref:DNA-(apurinic or apyrimidinic site) lyase n=1 Tax=Actinomadura barringtoniae TaxID=1427535 RepID=A0A939T914_9ACTN|nr:DNA-3-methyladenine glycosylase 2 family protein [Actinomadura barringtoniae]MBO2447505.1 DNA-3-methyladenine glycosylase 2 family protein [Actinomadura barringtoniae]